MLCQLAAMPVLAAPNKLTLVYEVSRKGQPFATVTETYTQNQGKYRIESTTKGVGLYALLGARKMVSEGNVSSQGLQPVHFELHQGDNAKKSVFADFDWSANTLRMQAKGKETTQPLSAGTQDLASFSYQWMFSPPQADSVNMAITTGKKLRQYTYQVQSRGERLNVPAGDFASLQLQNSQKNDEEKTLWLATEQHHVVLKMRMLDENGVQIEQVLKHLQLD